SPLAALRATMTTSAPMRASLTQASRPMPELAPVTRTILPCMRQLPPQPAWQKRSFCSQPWRQLLQVALHHSHVLSVVQLPQYWQRDRQSKEASSQRLRQASRCALGSTVGADDEKLRSARAELRRRMRGHSVLKRLTRSASRASFLYLAPTRAR